MGLNKAYQGYKSFSYLEAGSDYPEFVLCDELRRVEPHRIELSASNEIRAERLARNHIFISMHEHLGIFPQDIFESPVYCRAGRMSTGFEALSHGLWDAVFDNLMNGLCRIHSSSGWKWTEVLHDLGMRLCDIHHQDFVIPATKVEDIVTAHRTGKVAWIATMEGCAMIENELDRLDILYGFGVRSLGITYSESNALGSGLKESRDGGLTAFGKKAVHRMNKLGILIDCSHTGDQTALDTMEVSDHPIVLSHIGARALWNTKRMAPDEVLVACARKGGVIGVEAAPHTTLTKQHDKHSIESVMEHFEYIKGLVGIDHVSFGPDTTYGDHVGLHQAYAQALSIKESKASQVADQVYQPVEYVRGIENPTEASHNILRWLIKHGYSDDDIIKVMGGNVMRVLNTVWN